MRESRVEMGAVILTGAGKFVIADWAGLKMLFILCACVFWVIFILFRVKRDPSVLNKWGLTARNISRAARTMAPFATLLLSGMLVYGLVLDRLHFSWLLFPTLLLYPMWGLVQQFLIVALLAGNLDRAARLSRWAIILLTATLFALVHIPSAPLVVITFLMALVTTGAYFHTRSLYPIGLFHGWVATGAYFLVLGQDPIRKLLAVGLWP